MTISFNRESAKEFLKEQFLLSNDGDIDDNWEKYVDRLSVLCEDVGVRTHIAFLGTSLLAKALNANVDLYMVKPNHSKSENAYSARTLSEKVLVPIAVECGFDIGTSGLQPLNNQPYFRMTYLGDDTPVSARGRPPFEMMMKLIKKISILDSPQAAAALRSFIKVRRTYLKTFERYDTGVAVTLEDFAKAIESYVNNNSENGKRAQAIAAGLFDIIESPERILSGRVNDPSRKHPGDVCVLNIENPEIFDKAMEVRDKPVSESDVRIFGNICLKHGVSDVALLMVSDKQKALNENELISWAHERGIAFRLFYGWNDIISEVLFWGPVPMRPAVENAVAFIEARLAEVEVSKEGYALWGKMFRL